MHKLSIFATAFASFGLTVALNWKTRLGRVVAVVNCALDVNFESDGDVNAVVVLAAFILAAIEHFNHLVLALFGSKLCFLITVVSSSFI